MVLVNENSPPYGGYFLYNIYMSITEEQKYIIQGIELEIPSSKNIHKWDYREWKEGKHKYKSIWLDTYIKIDNAICICSYNLISVNGTKFFLDDKKLKLDDIECAKKIFKEIENDNKINK